MGEIRFGLFDEGSRKTFKDMADRYMQEYAIKKPRDSKRRDETSLKHLLPVFGDRRLSQITPDQTARYKTQRAREESSPASINHELAFAKHAFNLAIKEWGWVRDNPFTKVSMEKVNNARVKYLTEGEYRALLDACDDWLRPIIIMAANTGMRKGNIITLKWQDVSLDRKEIILMHTKNNERLLVRINQTLENVLKELARVRHIKSPFVFTNGDGSGVKETKLQKHFKEACKKAGIEDFRFHDLRHHFASMLVQKGVDLYVVQRLLGHKTSDMTRRYAHIAPDNLRDAVAMLDKPVDVVEETVEECA